MEIGVFKLTWIAQRDLEFKVHKEHGGKKKQHTAVRWHVKAVDSEYMNTLIKDVKFVSLLTAGLQLSTSVCIAVDKRLSAGEPTESWVISVCQQVS